MRLKKEEVIRLAILFVAALVAVTCLSISFVP